MENLFSRLTLDIIGKAVFDYDFDSLTHDDPVIKAPPPPPPPPSLPKAHLPTHAFWHLHCAYTRLYERPLLAARQASECITLHKFEDILQGRKASRSGVARNVLPQRTGVSYLQCRQKSLVTERSGCCTLSASGAPGCRGVIARRISTPCIC